MGMRRKREAGRPTDTGKIGGAPAPNNNGSDLGVAAW